MQKIYGTVKERNHASYMRRREKVCLTNQAYYWRNPEKRFDYELRRKYKMSAEDYAILLAAQDGKCLICNQLPEKCGRKSRLEVDHNHTTERVRALLCTRCNAALGGFREDPVILRAAISYLEIFNGS